MELKVKYSSRFKKGLCLAVKRGLDISLLKDIVEKLKARIPLETRYKDHLLSGNYKGYTLTLVDTGTHADLFKI